MSEKILKTHQFIGTNSRFLINIISCVKGLVMDFDLKQLLENAGVSCNDQLLNESTVASDETHNKIMKLGAIHTPTVYNDYYTLKNGRRIRLSTHPAFNTRSSLNVEYGGSKTGPKTDISDEELKRINELPEVEFKPNFTHMVINGDFHNTDLSDLSNGQLKTLIRTSQQDYTDAWVEAYKRGIIDKETYEKPLLNLLNDANYGLRSSKRMRNSNPDKQELIHYNEKRIKSVQSLLNISDAPVIKEFKLEEAVNTLPNENSLGEKIIPDDDPVKLQNFWNWFGDSKVVDEQGRPLVVYHKSPNKDIITFKPNLAQGWGKGVYFSDNLSSLDEFGDNVYVVYLKIEKPFNDDYSALEKTKAYQKAVKKYLDNDYEDYVENEYDFPSAYDIFENDQTYFTDSIYECGFDGIISENSNNIEGLELVVFKPNQIKSINNIGTFSFTSNNIYETVAYHGTPQKFDEFSLKYIGKGEGHHFYGWGLYFAEDMNSAYNFNKMRTDGNPDWVLPNGSPVSVLRFDDDKLVKQGVQFPNEAEAIGKYGEKAVDDLIEKYQDYIDRGSDRRSDIACLDFLKSIKGKLISGKGAVYQVEIPDDEYLMLWENRIFGETSRNSKYIQNCLKKMFEDVFPKYTDHLYDMTGADVYQDIAGWIGDKRNMDIKKAAQTYNGWQEYTLKTYQLTSMLLLKYGVKGIKYEKDGTNYVIFNPKDVHIQGDTRALWG